MATMHCFEVMSIRFNVDKYVLTYLRSYLENVIIHLNSLQFNSGLIVTILIIIIIIGQI
jgi:hypothetical protein